MQIPQYQTIEKKKEFFGERYLRINTKEEFDEWIKKHKPRKDFMHLFRGVPEAKYRNYSTAQREMFVHDWTIEEIKDKIKKQIKNLYDNLLLYNYCASINVPFSDLYLLSFAQHYGGKTPLIDFTSAIYNAIFFMLQDSVTSSENEVISQYSSLYMLKKNHSSMYNGRMLDNNLFRNIEEAALNNQKCSIDEQISNYYMFQYSFDNLNSISIHKPIIFDSYLFKKLGIGSPVHVTIPCLFTNLNIMAQNGCFVYNNWGNSLDQYLYCVDIHKSLQPYIKDKYSGHVSYELMYPDPKQIVEEAYNS